MDMLTTRCLGRQDCPHHMAEQAYSWVIGLCQDTQLDRGW